MLKMPVGGVSGHVDLLCSRRFFTHGTSFFFCAGVSLGSRESPSQLEEELIMRIDWFMKIKVGDE